MAQAISELKGQVNVGDVVGIEGVGDTIAYALVDIVDGMGQCSDPTRNVTKFYPVSELFDVNAVKQRCIQIVNDEMRAILTPYQNN